MTSGAVVKRPLSPIPPDVPILERRVAVPGGQVHVRCFNPDADATPLVVLHGGPGFPTPYLEPLAALSSDRPLILYDQLGCGESDRPEDVTLWTLDRFAVELDAVLNALTISRCHLFGHSWGSLLAVHFHARYGPTRLRSLILCGAALRIDWWEEDCATLVAQLDPAHRHAIAAAQLEGNFQSEAFLAAQNVFYGRHVSKYGLETELFHRTLAGVGAAIYHHFQGPNEFIVTGALKGLDLTPQLADIAVPTLYLTGVDDEARPDTVARYLAMTPGARMVTVRDAGHVLTLDQPDECNAEIALFLDRVEAAVHVGDEFVAGV